MARAGTRAPPPNSPRRRGRPNPRYRGSGGLSGPGTGGSGGIGGLSGPGGLGTGGGGLSGPGSVVMGAAYRAGLLSEGARISLPYLSVAGAARGRGARPQIAVKARERAGDGGEGAARTMGRVLPYGE